MTLAWLQDDLPGKGVTLAVSQSPMQASQGQSALQGLTMQLPGASVISAELFQPTPSPRARAHDLQDTPMQASPATSPMAGDADELAPAENLDDASAAEPGAPQAPDWAAMLVQLATFFLSVGHQAAQGWQAGSDPALVRLIVPEVFCTSRQACGAFGLGARRLANGRSASLRQIVTLCRLIAGSPLSVSKPV